MMKLDNQETGQPQLAGVARDMPALFRREAVAARRDAWLGQVRFIQPLSTRIVVLSTVMFLAAGLLFAITGSYTRRVHAAGVMMPSTGLITITTPAAGVVSSTAVIEGRRVSAGQLLFVVDRDANSGGRPTQRQIIAALTEQRTALQRERSNRQSMASVQKQSLSDQMANLTAQRDHLATQLKSDEDTLPVMRAAMDRLAAAADQHIVRNSDYQSQVFAFSQLLGQHAQFQQASLAVEGKIADIRGQLETFDDNLARDISQTDRAISQLDQQITERQAGREIEILAPSAGTLTAVRVHPGQTVAQGSPLVTLLSSDVPLEAHLLVDSSSIGFIRDNASVLLRYAAFPFQRFGFYEGRVQEITRAPVQAEPSSSDQAEVAAPRARAQRPSQYRVVVAPRLPYAVAYGAHRPLEVGMEVEADIALDGRRLYQWLLDPLYRARGSFGVVVGASASAEP
jgi:membrane fusion protein